MGLMHDIGIAIIVATVVSLVMHWLRQPAILGYLISGMIIGPNIGPQLITDPEHIETMSEIGLVLLLFIIGLEMDPGSLLNSGKLLGIGGGGQIVLSATIGILLFSIQATGFDRMSAVYLGLLATMSSTAIVVKSLNDKFALDSIHGKLSIGILILQDLFAILLLALQPEFRDPRLSTVGLALLKAVVLLIAAYSIGRWILGRILLSVSASPETVVAISIGWCATVAGGAHALGLSLEMGALVAGLTVGMFPYSVHVTAKTLPLRDFFVVLFFVSLGMKMVIPDPRLIMWSLAIVAFIYFSRFIILYPLLRIGGAGVRTAFLVPLVLSQLSEFSLVIAAMGNHMGHIGPDILNILLYTLGISAILSSYGIKYSDGIWRIFARLFPRYFTTDARDEDTGGSDHPEIVILGYHRGARSLIEHLRLIRPSILTKLKVIDFNVEALRELRAEGASGTFGDISQLDTLEHSGVSHAKLVLLTIPDILLKGTTNLDLVRKCRSISPNARILATADSSEHIKILRTAGANDVLLPYSMIGEHLSDLVLKVCIEADLLTGETT